MHYISYSYLTRFCLIGTEVIDFHAVDSDEGTITWTLSSYDNFTISSEGVVTVDGLIDREVCTYNGICKTFCFCATKTIVMIWAPLLLAKMMQYN